jgi:hypothetical protein
MTHGIKAFKRRLKMKANNNKNRPSRRIEHTKSNIKDKFVYTNSEAKIKDPISVRVVDAFNKAKYSLNDLRDEMHTLLDSNNELAERYLNIEIERNTLKRELDKIRAKIDEKVTHDKPETNTPKSKTRELVVPQPYFNRIDGYGYSDVYRKEGKPETNSYVTVTRFDDSAEVNRQAEFEIEHYKACTQDPTDIVKFQEHFDFQ